MTPQFLISTLSRLFCSVLLGLILLMPTAFPASAATSKTIVFGGNQDYPPYEFYDKDGNPTGYNVELMKAIGDVMGIKVKFRLGAWVEIRKALDKGEIDALQGMSYSDGRARDFAFSLPHTMVNHSVFARKGTPPVDSIYDLKGKEVAFHNKGFVHDYLVEKQIDANYILTDTQASALRLIASGKHDYAVVASLPGAYIIKEHKLTNVVPINRSIASVKYCIAVKKGNEELLAKLNEGLAILKQTGQYQAIYDKWLGVLEPAPVPWKKVAYYWIISIGLLLAFLAATLLWSRSLKRQVAIRTEALEQEVQERKRAAEALRQGQQQLVQADKMASLGILVSGVAHEVNNPNALILLNAPLVLDYVKDCQPIIDDYARNNPDLTLAGLPHERITGRIQAKIVEIQDAAQKIKRIVDDLKDFARHAEPEHTSLFDINTTAQMSIRLLENKIRKSSDHFTTAFAPLLPCIKGNPHRIEQVILNLLLNACQALKSPSEGIHLATEYDSETKMICLTITDEGEGIAPENMDLLLDPFFTTKRDRGGTGLGLSVSAGIVKEHNGTLEFASTSGKGTVVTLRLPACIEETTT